MKRFDRHILLVDTEEGEERKTMDRTQQLQAARRTSELWACTMLQDEELQLRQPCTVPLVEEVPFRLRQKVVRM